MSGWGEIFLGIIAVATLAIAVVQIGVAVAAGLLVRRIDRLTERIDREVQPLFGYLNAIGQDASRAVALATAQVERADQLFGDVAARIEQSLDGVQAAFGVSAREGRALWRGLQVAFEAIRDLRSSARGRQTRSDDEDALFI